MGKEVGKKKHIENIRQYGAKALYDMKQCCDRVAAVVIYRFAGKMLSYHGV